MNEKSKTAADDLLVVVELTRPHGLRGELSGRCDAVEPPELRDVPLVLRRPSGDLSPVRIASARKAGDRWLVTLDGVADRTAAEALRGSALLARRGDLPERPAGEWYVADLVGLVVEDEQDGELGVLEEVLKLPANDVFVVRGRRGEVLVPVLEDVIVHLDRERGRVRVKLPLGLLDAPEPEMDDES